MRDWGWKGPVIVGPNLASSSTLTYSNYHEVAPPWQQGPPPRNDTVLPLYRAPVPLSIIPREPGTRFLGRHGPC